MDNPFHSRTTLSETSIYFTTGSSALIDPGALGHFVPKTLALSNARKIRDLDVSLSSAD